MGVPDHAHLLHPGVSAMTMALGPSHHTCMITSECKVKCWGRNEEGELGIGSTAQQDSPAEVPGAAEGDAHFLPYTDERHHLR